MEEEVKPSKLGKWLHPGLAFLSAVAAIASMAAWPNMVLDGFGLLRDNLPLTLPILTVALSVLLAPHEFWSREGFLRLTSYFALGLVSFSIWYFVASQTPQLYIIVSSQKVLNKEHALLVVIMAFIWAGFCSVVKAVYDTALPADKRKWRTLQSILLGLSAAFLILPFRLFEDRSIVEKRTGVSFETKHYVVSIAFRDPSFNQYLGRSTAPITQCEIFRDIAATSRLEAISQAKSKFAKTDQFWQFIPPAAAHQRLATEKRAVEILGESTVAQDEP